MAAETDVLMTEGGKCMADEANLIILLLASYGLLGLKVFGKFRLAGLRAYKAIRTGSHTLT